MGGEKDVGGDKEERGRIEQRGNTSGVALVHILHTDLRARDASASWEDNLGLSDPPALNIISVHSYNASIYDIAAAISAGYQRRGLETCPRWQAIDRGGMSVWFSLATAVAI